jgi:hypothetical protein
LGIFSNLPVISRARGRFCRFRKQEDSSAAAVLPAGATTRNAAIANGPTKLFPPSMVPSLRAHFPARTVVSVERFLKPVVGKIGDRLTSYFRDFGKFGGHISDTRTAASCSSWK